MTKVKFGIEKTMAGFLYLSAFFFIGLLAFQIKDLDFLTDIKYVYYPYISAVLIAISYLTGTVVQLIIFALRPVVLSEKRKYEFFRPLTKPYNNYPDLFQKASVPLLEELDQKWRRYELLRMLYDGIPLFLIIFVMWSICYGTKIWVILFVIAMLISSFLLLVFSSREQANTYMAFLYSSLKLLNCDMTPDDERLFKIVVKERMWVLKEIESKEPFSKQ